MLWITFKPGPLFLTFLLRRINITHDALSMLPSPFLLLFCFCWDPFKHWRCLISLKSPAPPPPEPLSMAELPTEPAGFSCRPVKSVSHSDPRLCGCHGPDVSSPPWEEVQWERWTLTQVPFWASQHPPWIINSSASEHRQFLSHSINLPGLLWDTLTVFQPQMQIEPVCENIHSTVLKSFIFSLC